MHTRRPDDGDHDVGTSTRAPESAGPSPDATNVRANGGLARLHPLRIRSSTTPSHGVFSEDRWITGTAATIGSRIGVTPWAMRGAFVTLFAAGGWGLPLYAAGWLYVQRNTNRDRIEPSPDRHLALALVTLGLVLGARVIGVGFVGAIVWPVAAIAAGSAVALGRAERNNSLSPNLRLAAGLVIVVAGLIAMRLSSLDADEVVLSVVSASAVVAGMALISAPLLVEMRDELTAARDESARARERERMAAHLHDSVLQTLSLIQRNAQRPDLTAHLARKQERELRSWLYETAPPAGTLQVGPELSALADEIERRHGVVVEVVTVGDTMTQDAAESSSEQISAILAATREALTNAAKHSGSERIDVFCEIGADQIEIFVRDTGTGFSADDVADDRRGIAESIEGRMERAGGKAIVSSARGEGTEVELFAPLRLPDDEEGASQ